MLDPIWGSCRTWKCVIRGYPVLSPLPIPCFFVLQTAEASLLHEGDSCNGDLIPAARYGMHSAGRGTSSSGWQAHREASPLSTNLPRLSSLAADYGPAAAAAHSNHGNRPPSPRSLLANPQVAAAFVSTPRGSAKAPAAATGMGLHRSSSGRDSQDDSDSEQEGELALVAPAASQSQQQDGGRSGVCKASGSGNPHRHSLEQARDSFLLSKGRGASAHMKEGSPSSSCNGSGAARNIHRCSFENSKGGKDGAAAGSSGVGEESASKPRVLRTKTPGFMLVNSASTSSSSRVSEGGVSPAAAKAAGAAVDGDELLVLGSHEFQFGTAPAPPAAAAGVRAGSGRGVQHNMSSSSSSPAAAAAGQMHAAVQQGQQQQQHGRIQFPGHTSGSLDALEAALDEVLTLKVDSCAIERPALQHAMASSSSSRSTEDKVMQQPGSPLKPAAEHRQKQQLNIADSAAGTSAGGAAATSSTLPAGSSQATTQPEPSGRRQAGANKASEGELHQGWLEEDWDESDGEGGGSAGSGPGRRKQHVQHGPGKVAAASVEGANQAETAQEQLRRHRTNPNTGPAHSSGLISKEPAQVTGNAQWLHEDWDEE